MLALAGCQTTGASVSAGRVLTDTYDGDYTLAVGRTHNPTPSNAGDPLSYPNKYDSLAFLRLRVESGRFSVVRVDESVPGTGYSNLSGSFYDGGLMELSSTMGFMYGQLETYRLSVSAEIGDQLLSGEEITLRPQGFNANYAAHLVIAKVG